MYVGTVHQNGKRLNSNAGFVENMQLLSVSYDNQTISANQISASLMNLIEA